MTFSRLACRFFTSATVFVIALNQLSIGAATAQGAEKKDKTPAHIRMAITKGVKHLKGKQENNGQFTGAHQNEAGQTALAVYALRKSGVKPTDPVIAKALPILLKYARQRPGQDRNGIYNTGIVILALESLHNQEGMIITRNQSQGDPEGNKKIVQMISYKKDITRCAYALVKLQSTVGGWDYGGRGRGDLSNTQYAILGLWAAKRVGVKVPKKTFEKCAMWLLKDSPKHNIQQGDGSFRYRPQGQGTHSMATAGIGSLAIIYEQLKGKRIKRPAANPKKPDIIERGIEKGFGWLEKNAVDLTGKYYTLYGLERSCVLTGTKEIWKSDWYRPQADKIVTEQLVDGGWNQRGTICGTSWALSFLNRATEKIPYVSKEAEEAIRLEKRLKK